MNGDNEDVYDICNEMIGHIYRKGPADKEWLNIKEGDCVFALDGTTIKTGDNYWKLLNGTLYEYVTVRIGSMNQPSLARFQ